MVSCIVIGFRLTVTCRLHMLEEVEEFVREVVFEKDDIGVKLDRILLNWKNRLTATQVICNSIYNHYES